MTAKTEAPVYLYWTGYRKAFGLPGRLECASSVGALLRGCLLGAPRSRFANIYPNCLDHFIKEKLKARHYIRYMDDFLILHRDRGLLETYKSRINEFLKTEKLELHPEESKVLPLHRVISFRGFRIFYHYELLKESNMRVIKKRLQKFERLYGQGKLSREEVMEIIEGWMAYAKTGNTFNLRQSLLKSLNLCPCQHSASRG